MSTPKTFRLPDHVAAWIESARNQTAYLSAIMEEREQAYAFACLEIAGFSRPALMAVADVQNGHLYTEEMSTRDEIVFNLEDAADVLDKWGVSEEERARLMQMDERTARALRLVVEEFWHGRELP